MDHILDSIEQKNNEMLSSKNTNQSLCLCILLWTGCLAATTSAFVSSPSASKIPTTTSSSSSSSALYMNADGANDGSDGSDEYKVTKSMPSTRQAFLASMITSTATLATAGFGFATTGMANAEEESFESIAARAASMATRVQADDDEATNQQAKIDNDPRTAYDFSLPMAGEPVSFAELIRQEFAGDVNVKVADAATAEGSDATAAATAAATAPVANVKRDAKVKAILVVNMKQDDPMARKNIPELISLASKYVMYTISVLFCSVLFLFFVFLILILILHVQHYV